MNNKYQGQPLELNCLETEVSARLVGDFQAALGQREPACLKKPPARPHVAAEPLLFLSDSRREDIEVLDIWTANRLRKLSHIFINNINPGRWITIGLPTPPAESTKIRVSPFLAGPAGRGSKYSPTAWAKRAMGHDDLCVFANGKTPRSNAMQTQGMECRLHRLEELVASFTAEPGLASQLPNSTKPIDVIKTSLDDDSSQEGSIPELGTMEEKTPYRGSTNWQDVLQEYEEHWRNPDRTDVAWLGLLFSMLWMTVQSEIESPKDAAQYMGVGESLADLFRTRTAHCLMHANITRSEPHVIETMCFQALAEYMRRKDIESGIWMALGQIVRAAMRMGFHRDPSHYPKAFSPFQGEMRRRLWAFICQADHVCSFHIGLPSMISSAISDTAMPSNLHDWELTEGMAKLPPSRPMSEVTGITYMVTKSQILQTVGRIGELLYNTKQMSYDRVLQLDQELFQVVRDIPEPFRMTSWNAAETESLFKTMQRVHVGILYSEGMCALHRKYISTARKDQKFALSRQRCLQSAIALIDLQTGLQSLLRPGHHLEQSRWCLAPVANSSFRLAIMIVCLDLQQDGDAQSESIEADDVLIGINRADRMKKVEGAWDTWMNLGDTTAEGQKFHRVFAAVLQKLRSEQNGGPDGGLPPPKTPGTLAYTPPQDFSPDMGSGGAGSSIPSSVAYAPGFDDHSSSSAYTEPTPPPVGAPEFYTEVPDLLDTVRDIDLHIDT
ncbi:C6 transcription factor [Histoplasma capsulatum var. duboisii H88]|uniref:C6 transcription factor n=1 Tax=Ajellomyces capsulatus (strain H88) TaxID=544711 RepID=F0UP10_AJEC8|nr:C6 transcription factor [Histoplasma capsulatum var. duboisii H88]